MAAFFRSERANRFAQAISLPQQALAVVTDCALTEARYRVHYEAYRKDPAAFFAQICALPDAWQHMLGILFYFCEDQWRRLYDNGIDPSVADQTFASLRTACEEHFEKHGQWGLSNYGWIAGHIDGHILRIGRLQFQPYALESDIRMRTLFLPRACIVLNIHIPGREPLDHDACLASYRRAARFFPAIAPVFHCNSWLLYPALRDLLPAESNIIRFQSDYAWISQDDAARQAEERIWGCMLDNPADYSTDNTLRARARAHLMSGGQLGRATGIISAYYL